MPSQFWTDSFVIFEFALMLGAPLVALVSLIVDLVLLRKRAWIAGLVTAAVLNAAVVLLWLGTVGTNLLGLQSDLVTSGDFFLGALLLPALFLAPIGNLAFFIAYAIAARGRRHRLAEAGPADASASAPVPSA